MNGALFAESWTKVLKINNQPVIAVYVCEKIPSETNLFAVICSRNDLTEAKIVKESAVSAVYSNQSFVKLSTEDGDDFLVLSYRTADDGEDPSQRSFFCGKDGGKVITVGLEEVGDTPVNTYLLGAFEKSFKLKFKKESRNSLLLYLRKLKVEEE